MMGPVGDIVYSRNGSVVVSAGDGGTICFSSPDGHGETARAIVTDQDTLGAIAVSPDGKSVASGGSDGSIKIWSVDNAGQVLRSIAGQDGFVTSLGTVPMVRNWSRAGASFAHSSMPTPRSTFGM